MTKIEWTDESWNPFRARNKETGGVGHYCSKVDPACLHCYAEPFQPRYKNPIRYAAQDLALVSLFLDEDVLLRPLRMRARKMIFPCSMTDLFGEFYPDDWIDKVVAVAAVADWHVYQVLTKRADRMLAYWTDPAMPERVARACEWITYQRVQPDLRERAKAVAKSIREVSLFPLPNWWQGVSAGTQKTVDERLPLLLQAPVSLRWVSLEPILEDLNVEPFLKFGYLAPLIGIENPPSIAWGVVGGESGQRARVTRIAHIRTVVNQFVLASIPLFVKQMGARPVDDNGEPIHLVAPKGGDPSEWPAYLRVREYPARAAELDMGDGVVPKGLL